jgi:hypothetical protein
VRTEASLEYQRGLLFGDPAFMLGAQERDMYRAETLDCEIVTVFSCFFSVPTGSRLRLVPSTSCPIHCFRLKVLHDLAS